MKLSVPFYVLKRKAKELKCSKYVTITEALNQIAKAEGFCSWSLLLSKVKTFVPKTKEDILNYLNSGDLLIIGSQPGLGKTVLTLQLLLQAIKKGRLCFFFSFEYT
jgi:replicative DNA helicase|tara:strand:- start:739 stop:1056 length:318 start_codon:yes stop_codon:yes gene_type:complete